MQTIDYVKYFVSKVDDKNFTINSLAVGFLACPEAKEYAFTLTDNTGNLAVVSVIRTGSNLAVQQLRFSSAGANMPSFTGQIEAYPTYGADLINQQFGECIGVYAGESNMQGGKIAAPDPEIDAVYDSITQYRYQSFLSDGTTSRGDTRFNLKLRDASDDVHLYWPAQAGLGSALVTSATHAANSMARYGGHVHQQMMLGAQWGTAIGTTSGSASDPGAQWASGTGSLYLRLRDMTIAALNRKASNYLGYFYCMIGVNDAVYGVTPDASLETDYAAAIDSLITTFLSEVGSATQRDLTKTPVILVSLPQSYVASGGIRATRVNNAILDTPNRLPWTSVIDCSDMEVRGVDTYHWSVEELREIGAERFPVAYFQALGNFPTGAVAAQLIANASATTTVTADLTAAAKLTAAASGTATVTADLSPGGAQPAELAANATGVATVTADLSAGSPALPLAGLFLKGTGITQSAPDLTSWADQSTSGDGDITTTGQSNGTKPHVSNGSIVTDGVDDYMQAPDTWVDDISNGVTLIVDMTTSEDGTGNPYFFGGDDLGFRASLGNLVVAPNNAFGGFTIAGALAGFANGVRKIVEIVVPPSGGGAAELYIDGVLQNPTGTAGDQPSPNGFYFGSNEQWGTFSEGTYHNIAFARTVLTEQQRTDTKALFL